MLCPSINVFTQVFFNKLFFICIYCKYKLFKGYLIYRRRGQTLKPYQFKYMLKLHNAINQITQLAETHCVNC